MRVSIIPIESKRSNRPYCPVDDFPSLMDGWRALNLGVHVWIQDGFNIEKESRQERWAVKRRDGRYYCGPQEPRLPLAVWPSAQRPPGNLRGPFPLDQTKEALRVRVVPSFRTHPRAKLLAITREAATVTITRVRNLLENGPQIPVLSKRPVRIEEREKPPASVCLTDAITPNPLRHTGDSASPRSYQCDHCP